MKSENKKIARLIKQIQHGNQSAFEEFYKLTSPKAYFIALKITQNEHDAEDILQESYIKALEKINEIDTSQNINSWFLKIVSNKSKDFLKSKKCIVFDSEEESYLDETPEEKTEFCPEENLNQEELRLEVMAAIDELTAEKRACIMMMYFGDMSVKEIAESIEIPENTVKSRLYHARKELRTKFEKNGNVLYGAALGGILVWALTKSCEITASAFASSAASGAVLANASSSAAAAAASASTASAAASGIAAKAAALTVAQKVVAGVAATAVIGGSAAGVATVAKNIVSSDETTTHIEEVTTAPSQTEEFAFAVVTTEESTTEHSSTAITTEPTESAQEKNTATLPSSASTAESAQTSRASTTKQNTTKKETTTRRRTSSKTTTTATAATSVTATSALTEPATTKPTTTEPVTEKATTAKPATTRPTTAKPATTQPTTAKPETTVLTTTQPATTEATTQAPATVNVEVLDMNEEVVASFSFTVEAGTEMTWEYLVTQIKNNGYEPKAGIYGDAIDAVAEPGTAYTITAEL